MDVARAIDRYMEVRKVVLSHGLNCMTKSKSKSSKQHQISTQSTFLQIELVFTILASIPSCAALLLDDHPKVSKCCMMVLP